MDGGRSTLDLVVHDAEMGSAMNLSLLGSSDRQMSLAGAFVAPAQGLVLSTRLDVSGAEPFGVQSVEDEGFFGTEYGTGEEFYDYRVRSFNVDGPFQLRQIQVIETESDLRYQCFALDDPFPLLLLIPIAGAIAGVAWLWRRHKTQDRSQVEIMKNAVEQGMAEGRPVHLHSESTSTVKMPGGGRLTAKSTFDVDIGGRPAA